MAGKTEDWRAALDFLPLGSVVEYAFRTAYRTGHSPHCEYALVRLESNSILCVVRSENSRSVVFMTDQEVEVFQRSFAANFFHAFRL